MKYIPESYEDVAKLCSWYLNGELTAEDYFEAVNEYAKIIVDRELNYEKFKNRQKGVFSKRRLWR